jgi:hypothetical protein
MSGSSTCRSCGRPIIWATFKSSGKNTPVDPNPTERGNIQIAAVGTWNGRVVFQAWVVPKKDRALHGNLHTSHFATCPNAATHRRGREPASGPS